MQLDRTFLIVFMHCKVQKVVFCHSVGVPAGYYDDVMRIPSIVFNSIFPNHKTITSPKCIVDQLFGISVIWHNMPKCVAKGYGYRRPLLEKAL